MESGQAVRPIFTSIITALQQRLMLYDSRAVPPTALEGCGSRWATGIMASVNLRCRTFTLKGPHVGWHGRINTVCTPLHSRNITRSPVARGSDLAAAASHFLAVTLPHFPMSLLISWVLNNHLGGKYGRDTMGERKHCLFRKDGRQMGPFISWVWSLVVGTCWPAIYLVGPFFFSNETTGVRCLVLSLHLTGLCLSLCW